MSDATSLAGKYTQVMSQITDARLVSERQFLGVAALLFVTSSAVTIFWCASMSEMGEMPMPGGWTMSMVWMPICGEMWSGRVTAFLGMWVVMMAAMMLPSLVPMLLRYRHALMRTGETRLGRPTTIAGVGYFFVWSLFGMAAFLVGATLSAVEVQQPALARAVPIAVGGVVLIAGVIQFTAWKAHNLTCWREVLWFGRPLSANPGAAWRQGVGLALHCGRCCANLMVILPAIGIMDLRAMVFVTAAITAERLAPARERVAQAIGAVVVGAGVILIAQAAGLP
jgi:predicted metal-binding membrane protein